MRRAGRRPAAYSLPVSSRRLWKTASGEVPMRPARFPQAKAGFRAGVFCRWRKRPSPAAQPGHDVDCGRAGRGETGGGLPSCSPADSCLFLRHASFSPSFVPLCLAPPPTFPPRRLSLDLVPRSAPCFSSSPGAPFRLPRAPSPRRALLRFLSHRLSRTACPDSCFRCLLPSFFLSALPRLPLFSPFSAWGAASRFPALPVIPRRHPLCPIVLAAASLSVTGVAAPGRFLPLAPCFPPGPQPRRSRADVVIFMSEQRLF